LAPVPCVITNQLAEASSTCYIERRKTKREVRKEEITAVIDKGSWMSEIRQQQKNSSHASLASALYCFVEYVTILFSLAVDISRKKNFPCSYFVEH
jgi:hypothetical protein